jgi:hypothetical protein
VDQVSQQRDTAAHYEHDHLSDGRDPEDRERERDGADALARALDAVVYEPVRVTVLPVVIVLVRLTGHRLRSLYEPQMTMRPGVGVAM